MQTSIESKNLQVSSSDRNIFMQASIESKNYKIPFCVISFINS